MLRRAAGLRPGAPAGPCFVGNVVEAIEAYGSGALWPAEIPPEAVDRIIAIGSDGMMNAVAEARRARLKQYFRPGHRAIASINSPMQVHNERDLRAVPTTAARPPNRRRWELPRCGGQVTLSSQYLDD